jgi:O-acetylserine/cysteine efflux transporter
MTPAKTAMPLGDAGLLILTAFLWASNNIAAKLIIDDMPPVFSAGLRFAITSLVLLPFLRIPGDQVKSMLGVALTSGPIHFGLLYTSFHLATAIGPITVVLQIWVAFATILSVAFLGERFGIRHLGGLVLAFAGPAIIGFDPAMRHDLAAILVACLTALAWGTSTVLARRAGNLSGIAVQAWMAMLAWPLLLAYSAATETGQMVSLQQADWKTWSLILYGALLAGIFGNVIMFSMVRKYEVSRTTPLLLLTPVFTEILGILVRDEIMTSRIALGTALTVAGVFILTLRAVTRKPEAAK